MRAYLRRLGELQSDILLGLAYLLVATPVWLALRARRKTLLGDAGWHARENGGQTIERLRAPF